MYSKEMLSAKEAYADGINWVFAPMIDLCREPRWGRVAEGAGEDPLLGSLIAQANVPAGETVSVTLEIPAERFALMTTDLREVVEPGEFVLLVGHDSTCSDAVSFTVK